MKKNILILLVLPVILLGFTLPSVAGKPFEGLVTYKISYPGINLPAEQQGMLPKILTVSIKGTKSRTEIKTGMGNQIEIIDYVSKTKIGLIDMMGQKLAVKNTTDDIEKEMKDAGDVKVTLTDETKTIAGYVCKKAVITVNNDGVESKLDAYYTSELGGKISNFDNPYYKDIDGVLLEFSMKTEQFNMEFSATSVEKKTVSAKDFEIPEGYKEVTPDELKKMFGGMGGGDK